MKKLHPGKLAMKWHCESSRDLSRQYLPLYPKHVSRTIVLLTEKFQFNVTQHLFESDFCINYIPSISLWANSIIMAAYDSLLTSFKNHTVYLAINCPRLANRELEREYFRVSQWVIFVFLFHWLRIDRILYHIHSTPGPVSPRYRPWLWLATWNTWFKQISSLYWSYRPL